MTGTRGLSWLVKPVQCRLLRRQPYMGIVLQHSPREVAGDRFDHVVRLAGLEEPGDDGVPEIVEAQAGKASIIT